MNNLAKIQTGRESKLTTWQWLIYRHQWPLNSPQKTQYYSIAHKVKSILRDSKATWPRLFSSIFDQTSEKKFNREFKS